MSDAALRNWTVSAVTEAFTLGHHDWRLRLASVRESFTDEGYESFLKGLDESLFLDRLRENLQVASAVAQGAPVVTETRYFEGQLGWAIEFPLLVTFTAGGAEREPEPARAGSGAAGAAVRAPCGHRDRAADRGQEEAGAMRTGSVLFLLSAAAMLAAVPGAPAADEGARGWRRDGPERSSVGRACGVRRGCGASRPGGDAVHGGADRGPGPPAAGDAGGRICGCGSAACGTCQAGAHRRARRRNDPDDLGAQGLPSRRSPSPTPPALPGPSRTP